MAVMLQDLCHTSKLCGQLQTKSHGLSKGCVAKNGSGKTEAALYWALGDGSVPVPRLFYTPTLPGEYECHV